MLRVAFQFATAIQGSSKFECQNHGGLSMKRDPLIPLNRRLNILKMLHGKELRTAEITEAYGVDDRTIRTDLETLRDGLEVMGTTVKIVEQRSGHSNLSYKSTVHPIFLALNLSEVFALLKALEQAAQGIMTGDVYRNIFNNVYCQLSDYAKKMLDGKLELGIKSADQKVTNRLEEEMVDKSEDYKLIYLEKSGRGS